MAKMWRTGANLVCFINFILLGFGCLIYALLIIIIIDTAPSSLNPLKYQVLRSPLSERLKDNLEWKPYRNQVLKAVFVVAVGLLIAVPFFRLSIDCFLVRTLYTACDSSSEVTVAIKKGRLWKNIHIFFLLFYPFNFFFYFFYPQLVILLYYIIAFIWRTVEIIIIDKYIDEMREDSRRARDIGYNYKNIDNKA